MPAPLRALNRETAGPVPQEALDYFEAKEIRPGFSHLDVWGEEHTRAFTAAKFMREDVLAIMQASLATALREGQTYEMWARGLQPELERLGFWGQQRVVDPLTGREVEISVPHRLEHIFRQNMRTARAAGQWERIQRTKASHPYLLYLLGPSERHRPEHAAWHGLLLPVEDPFWQKAFPPNGHGCFLPGTRVTGNVTGASKAWYAGEAIEVELQSGATLTVTANHPVATTNGWVAAGTIQVGDQCISHGAEVKRVGGLRAPDVGSWAVGDQQIPARIEDVFDALAAHGRSTIEVSELDFHGEARFFEGEVQVVGSYVPLVHRAEPALAQSVRQGALSRHDARLIQERGVGHQRPFLGAMLAPARGLPRRTADALGLGAVSPLPALVCRTGASAHRESTSLEKLAEGGATHTAFIRELLDRNPGAVALDQVVGIRRYPYSGHVYDLESESGWILANGIAASNCKCHVRQVSRREGERLERDGLRSAERTPILDAQGLPTGRHLRETVPVRRVAPPLDMVPFENKRTGQIEFVPRGIDPGFAHPPSQLRNFQGGPNRPPTPAPAQPAAPPPASFDDLRAEVFAGGATVPRRMERAEVGQLLGQAMETRDGGMRTRRLARAVVRSHLGDAMRTGCSEGSRADELEFGNLPPRVGGMHGSPTGRIKLRTGYRAGLERAARALAAGKRLTKAQAESLHTLIHETVHGFAFDVDQIDDAVALMGDSRAGRGIEEVVTESVTRRLMREAFGATHGLPDLRTGKDTLPYYSALLHRTMQAVDEAGADLFPEESDDARQARVQGMMEAAAVTMRQRESIILRDTPAPPPPSNGFVWAYVDSMPFEGDAVEVRSAREQLYRKLARNDYFAGAL